MRHLLFLIFGFTILICQISCKQESNAVPEVPVPQDSMSLAKVEIPLDSSLYKFKNGKVLLQWDDLLKISFEKKMDEKLGMEVDLPVFNERLKALEGKEVIAEGFYIPVDETGDENIVILSAYPFAQCFFCGQAGVESIIDIIISEKLPHFKTDTKVKFSGKLKLNADNFDFLIYMLEDAKLEK